VVLILKSLDSISDIINCLVIGLRAVCAFILAALCVFIGVENEKQIYDIYPKKLLYQLCPALG